MEKYNKNDNADTVYISEKQAIRGIFIGIILLCVIIIASYIVGYRAAIKNLTEETKKTSFADQVYTALSGRISDGRLDDSHRYYIKIFAKNINEMENIVEVGAQNGISLMRAPGGALDDEEKKCHYIIISSLIDSYNDAATIITALRNKVVIDEYEITTIDK